MHIALVRRCSGLIIMHKQKVSLKVISRGHDHLEYAEILHLMEEYQAHYYLFVCALSANSS